MYDPRSKYLADAVETASPAKLLTMLYDRLVLDLDRAARALRDGDQAASQNLLHAQDILAELMSSLDVHAWDGGPGLMSVYTYLTSELITANVTSDAAKVDACLALVSPLRDAWHEASESLAVPARATAHGDLGVG
jgi:flagellar secretion chaperone FliS